MARYSDNQKADALAALTLNGGNVAKTAKQLGIPRVTLTEWRDGRVSEDVSEIRHHVEEALESRLERLLGVVTDQLISKAPTAKFSELAFGLEKATHVMQLLKGKPTNINEHHGLPEQERVDRASALFDAARTRRAGQPAEGDQPAVN